MSYDPVHAVGGEHVRGANGQLKCETGAEHVEAVCAQETACDGEERPREKDGCECGKRGGVGRDESGEEVVDGTGEAGGTVVAQGKEDRDFECGPGP